MHETSNETGGRILVVDDESSIVDAVATALRYEGFEVEEAYTGREALAAVARFDPELIVPNPDLSIADGAITPWAGATSRYFSRLLEAVGEEYDIPLDVPWKRLTKRQQRLLLDGAPLWRCETSA